MQYLEGTHESLVYAHHGACVVELSTVVGGGEDGHQLPFGKEFIPILHHLQRSAISNRLPAYGASSQKLSKSGTRTSTGRAFENLTTQRGMSVAHDA